ncbi:nucleotidyltransferase family protein [uncultured Intestinimonas sp.]|uniref:tRNA(Met) cytidine acetate ligase n=1 Tax=uncultured Intestinimonas sp. TaxID=1689265 RepID=UPI0025DCCFC3|nr:nucleotidyltransferase family protein [uncultured Intestinimonas sp.]
MNVAGIIAEYNPFHRGHDWQIDETRRTLGADTAVVCAMSGHWVQRGECAVTDKWTRAAMALRGGADLILELPTPWACASAETFARGGVGVLSATGVVDTLSFGSESGELEGLRRAAECLDSEDYRTALRGFLDQGLPFAVCRHRAAEELLGAEGASRLENPNDNLGVEYLRALPPEMGALTVRRVGARHDGAPAEGFASASTLRAWLRQGKIARAEGYLTECWQGDIASMEWCERWALARLRTMSLAEAEALPDSGEGLAARLLEAGRRAGSLEEVYNLAKTKRYAHARVRRLTAWAMLGLTAADRPSKIPYLKVLGFTDRGREVLREMRKRASIPVITKPAHAKALPGAGEKLAGLEARCTDLYGLCFARPWPGGVEWRTGPVVLSGQKKNGEGTI